MSAHMAQLASRKPELDGRREAKRNEENYREGVQNRVSPIAAVAGRVAPHFTCILDACSRLAVIVDPVVMNRSAKLQKTTVPTGTGATTDRVSSYVT